MRARERRGFTLVEVMVAMAILLIGALGLVGLANQSNAMNADGRRVMRATAIAQDLVGQIELWPYDDARLANTTPDNDADLGDKDGRFMIELDPLTSRLADHGESDLGPGFLGTPAAELAAGQYERFWSVAELDDWNANGIADMRRIAVVVRWPQGAGWRRIVLFTTKINPAESL